jgi:hypothetical protein
MCSGGNRKQQAAPVQAQPVTAPIPPLVISPSNIEGQKGTAVEQERKANFRRGLSSTIKTSTRGIAGSGAELVGATLTGKQNLGS